MLRNNGLLQDTVNVPIEEQFDIFLYIRGDKSKNRIMQVDFIRSGKTISRSYLHSM